MDLDPETVIESGRLGPGQMLGVDMAEHTIYHNEEMLDAFDAKATYAKLVEDTPLVPIDRSTMRLHDGHASLRALQRGFGYTKEDVKMILKPMAATGKDAVWSMGDDTPLAFLARSPRPLYCVLPAAVCAGDEPGDRSAARGDCGVAAYAAGAVGAHAG